MALKRQSASAYLDDLLPPRVGEREVSGGFKMLSHEMIAVQDQVRRTISKGELEELRDSIRALHSRNEGIEGTGILQALLVTPVMTPEGTISAYRLIAGEKRFRASKEAQVPELPCVIIPTVTEPSVRLMQLTENAQRTPPPVLEEANAIWALMQEQHLSYRDVARLLGKNRGYVENRVALVKTSQDVQDMVSLRNDSLSHALEIDALKNSDLRQELIAAVIEEEISVAELRRRIRDSQPQQQEPSAFRNPSDPTDQEKGESTDGAIDSAGQISTEIPEAADQHSETEDKGEDDKPAPEANQTATEGNDLPFQDPTSGSNTAQDPNIIEQLLQPAANFLAEADQRLSQDQLAPPTQEHARQVLTRITEIILKLQQKLA